VRRAEAEADGLLNQAAAALRDEHPLALLGMASGLLNALDPRNDNPFDRTETPERPPLGELLDSLAGAGEPEAAALALTMAHLGADDLARTRTVRTARTHAQHLPRWLEELDRLVVAGAEEIRDELRDSFNVLVHTRLGGHDLTAVVLVDFNLGTIVKDCFFADRSLDELNALWRQQDDAPTDIRSLSLADARARIADAVETGARTWPPEESDDWPASRPLLEWILRSMPTGGTGFDRPEWPEEETGRLADRFLASSYGQAFASSEDRSIVDDLLWYRTGYGYGDPLRWSGAAVEILLLDWYPRKILAERELLLRMPDVLRAFIQFAHAESGLDESLTAETLQALDGFEPEYRSAVGRPRRQGPEALLERMGVLDPLAEDPDDPLDFADLERFQRSVLAEMVGGEPQLDRLTAEPLPDEPFDAQGIPDQIAGRVAETLALVDRCCEELLDMEHRTAVRRLLHDVAIADPRSFDGRSKPRTAAAGLCWMVGRANESVGYGDLQTQELMAWFGLKTAPVARAESIRRALGLDPLSWPGSLGSARYLTGRRRAALVEQRDLRA